MENSTTFKVKKDEIMKESETNIAYLDKKIEEEVKYIKEILEKRKEMQKTILEENKSLSEEVLNRYYPLKKEIENLNKILKTKEFKEQSEDEFFEGIMKTRYKDISDNYEELENLRDNLQQNIDLIDGGINAYIEKLKKDNDIFEELLSKDYSQKLLDKVGLNERKILLLEKHYKEGVPVKKIKLDYYENERRYHYDSNELLTEISKYFTGIYTIITLF